MHVQTRSESWLRTAARHMFQVVGKIVAIPVRRQLDRLERTTQKPREVQADLLEAILQRQARTQFGSDHDFLSIRTLADFRQRLPIADYDYFEPYIAEMRKGRFEALVAGERVHMFAMTSGTTSSRKYIPVTDSYLESYRRGWNMWGLKCYRDHREITLRPIVQFSSDWEEFRTEGGIPCGSVTGLTAITQKRIVRWVYCVPPACAKIKDPLAKYYTVLRLSVPYHPGMIIAANPSTMITLARIGDREKETLIRDIHDGTLSNRFDVPTEVRTALRSRLKKLPERAAELESVVERTTTLYPRDYWPKPFLLGNWTGGSVGAYLRHYPQYFGHAWVRDVGLIASEGRMTIPISDNTSGGILDVQSHFYEFIPEDEINSPQPTVLGAHELVEGGKYYILLTTSYGLYRYDIHDVVRVVGFHNKTPIVEFLSKGSYFANITGEKVSEYHITRAMIEVLRSLDMTLTAYSVAPCWNDELPYYAIFLERGDLGGDLKEEQQGRRIAQLLEENLCRGNIEYAAKRETQRLAPIRTAIIPTGTWQQWDRERLSRTGGTPEQYKHPCLINDLQLHKSLAVECEL